MIRSPALDNDGLPDLVVVAGEPKSRVAPLQLATAVLLGSMAAVLAGAYAWFVPLQTDGGWYSYPGYALSQGRDPSENLLPAEQLMRDSRGVKAAFRWDTRSFLIVRLHHAWFALMGTTLLSLKVFGVLQWLAVATLVGSSVWLVTRSGLAALVAALAAMSDSWLISESMADLRPDVPIAVAGSACVFATLRYADARKWRWLVLGSLLAATLPLLHITGVLTLAFCAALATVLAATRVSERRFCWPAILAITACGVLAFWLRPILIDIVVPTTLPERIELPFRLDLKVELGQLLAMGVASKLKVEAARWADYFFISNAAHLVFVGVGLFSLLVSAVRNEDPSKRQVHVALAAGMIAAFAAFFVNPHRTPSHIVPVAAVAYIASGVGLHWLLSATSSTFLRSGVVALGLLAVLLKAAHVQQLVRTSVAGAVSNRNVAAFMSDTLEPGVNGLAIAPTSLWPYVDPTRAVVLVDPGRRMWEPADPRWHSVTTVILDREFLTRGWGGTLATIMKRCGAFEKKGWLGNRAGGGFYLEAYGVKGPPCVDASK